MVDIERVGKALLKALRKTGHLSISLHKSKIFRWAWTCEKWQLVQVFKYPDLMCFPWLISTLGLSLQEMISQPVRDLTFSKNQQSLYSGNCFVCKITLVESGFQVYRNPSHLDLQPKKGHLHGIAVTLLKVLWLQKGKSLQIMPLLHWCPTANHPPN